MDVASWVVLWSCVAQAAGDRYGPYGGAPGGATMPAGVPTSPPPAGSPYSPPPSQNYPAGAADPIYTAAGQKKTNPATSVTPTGVRPTTTPTPTPSSNAAPNSNAVRTQPPAATPPTTDKSAAGELIREAVVVPQSLSVAGRSASLYEAVAAAGDSQRQLDVVRTYWKAAGELAEYHYDWQQTQFLEHLQKVTAGRGGDSSAAAAEIAARLASARAEVREGELRLVDAQLRLGEVTPQTAAESRALPVDLPHVGIYHTRFEKVYAGRAPSTRAHALSRSLPLRKEVVDLRADGVWAAQDAYEAAFEAYQKGQLPIEEVLTALDDFRTRRNEFINSVRAYNDEIAEYAVLSAPWGSGPEALVRMLIKNPSRLPAVAAVGATVGEDGRVVPASF